MGFNSNSLSPQLVERVFLGLREKSEIPVVQELSAFPHQTPFLSGTLPTMPSDNTLATLAAPLAIGAQPKLMSFDQGSATFTIERWAGATKVPDHVVQNLDALGFSALDGFAKQALRQAKASCDKELYDLLVSTTYNNTSAASTAWSDSSSTPLVNLDTIFNSIGDADLLVIGHTEAQDLQKHPDIIAETSNFSAGAVPQSKIVSVLMGLYPNLKKIVIGGSLYNSAAEGQTAVLSRIFNSIVWAGHSDDLVYVQQTGIARTEMERDALSRTTIISYEEPGDIVRPNKDKGYYLSGT